MAKLLGSRLGNENSASTEISRGQHADAQQFVPYREDEQISACLGSRSPGFLQHHDVAMNGLPLVCAQHTLIEAYLA